MVKYVMNWNSAKYDETNVTHNCATHSAWDKSDNWKIRRKQRTRITNPAALLVNKPAGLTIEVDYKNQVIKLLNRKTVVAKYTFEQVKNANK